MAAARCCAIIAPEEEHAMPKAGLKRRPSSLPPASAGPPRARSFAVRCTRCQWPFAVERAPARCPRCGGVAVAG
jgi:rubrerythrin